ncbi:K(+)-transporting ATPase subunit C [Rhizosphaericola mali]|uniref:Potassium-transporting ATPase KdpC subunit n=1 Tax=Rhizosphaericola mali TaxID=2545455 RepID=A0A5P2FZJ0_9BACT|nr:K(+)-transporting ATPase subunit C [Rhizosphaericola mali]QES88367.1 K(+)-transporting ATPase subunit C [Rhizosphaericola mali]
MKKNILPAIRLTIICAIVFVAGYSALVFGAAKLAPGKGNGQTITVNGHKYYTNIGQKFTEDKYFNSRPSAVDYNAAGSAGSNKGPTNPEYLATVKVRVETFLVHNPSVKITEIPSDIVTASGSGLDPDISIQGATIQVARISKVRNLPEEKVMNLIHENIEKPFLGLFGTEKINVLKLNIALDNLK